MLISRGDKLFEYTKGFLLNKSRKDTPLRYARRVDAEDNWKLERVGLLELKAGSKDLHLYFKVKKYRVAVVILNFKPLLKKYLSGKFAKNPDKAITRAIYYALKYNHIKISCSCKDFKYRFNYMATKRKYGFDTNETRPSKITNPKLKGGLCKHQVKVMKSPSLWRRLVITSLKRYAKQMEEL